MCGLSLSAKGDGMGPELIAVFDAGNDDKPWDLGVFGGTHVRIVYIFCILSLYSICLLLMMIGVPLVRNYINVVNMCKSRIRS
jgi:hypothetical protein